VQLHLFRLGRPVERTLVLGSPSAGSYEIVLDENASAGARKVLSGWLGRGVPSG
jgi:hypothetical protein